MVFKAHFLYVFSAHFKPIYSLFLVLKKAYCGRHKHFSSKITLPFVPCLLKPQPKI